MSVEIKILENLEEISLTAARLLIEIGNRAISRNDRFTVALAGGSTPKSLYKLLATEEFKDQIEWSKVFFFFGDERTVLPDSDESNFKTAAENLFKPLKIKAGNIFRWKTEIGDAQKIAEDYSNSITEFFDLTLGAFPCFDLILLGMGDDGHTASLFPMTKAIEITAQIAVANRVEKLNAERLTFTFTTINNADNIIFLISGSSKAFVLKEVLEGDYQPKNLPSQNVEPKNGNLIRLIDEAAAEFLK